MTTSLNFKTFEQYTEYMETARAEICSCTLPILQEAYDEKEDNPLIMAASITGEDGVYEMTLARNQWPTMLEKCIEILSTTAKYENDAIDAYLLLKKLREE